MKTKTLLSLICLAGAGLAAGAAEFKIYGALKFDEPSSEVRENAVFFPAAAPDGKSTPLLFASNYQNGKGSQRLKVILTSENTVHGTGRACTFEPATGGETAIHTENYGVIKSSPDLWFAMFVHAPESSLPLQLVSWNDTKKVNRVINLDLKPDKWNFLKIKLNGPNFYEDGEIVQSVNTPTPPRKCQCIFRSVFYAVTHVSQACFV